MLQSLKIAGEATFPENGEALTDLKKVNYLFGHNGCGKTTISRAIENPDSREGFAVDWKDGREIKALVFNRDFAERNFGDQMRGIFTLGEDSKKATDEIATLSTNITKLNDDIGRLRRNLNGEDGTGGRIGELARNREALIEACWKSKTTHDGAFKEAFKGYRSSKPDFCDRVIRESNENAAPLKSLEQLHSDAETVFQSAATPENVIPSPNFDGFAAFQSSPYLSRRIVGRDDVVVAELIKRLGNSDWVKQGVDHLLNADGVCPFCQQAAPPNLLDDLNSFFDKQYEADLAELSALASAHAREVNTASAAVETIIEAPNRFIDVSALQEKYQALKASFELNQERLSNKLKEPSSVVELEDVSSLTAAISELISSANEATKAYNATIDDLDSARKQLTSEVWRYVVEERRTDLDTHATTSENIQRAIDGMTQAIAAKNEKRSELMRERSEIEKNLTSVRPAVESINRILTQYGFSNFRLEVAGEREDMYQIVRPDGSQAAHSLSEGEKSFITFLYFYHQLAGSTSRTGMSDERIVVFDDPVSSLDADVLFVVSALIRKVIGDVSKNRGNILQVFVLTHNIYFHKEVSFDRDRHGGVRPYETFWIVRKRGDQSSLHRYEFNPVKTSYELLWDEVRNPDRANLTIQNTLRRIVENYLTVLGGLKPDEIVAHFEGRDAQICASMFSWINDGSHSAHDDVYVAIDDNAVESYLRVFKEVFERTGHSAHYEMMMKISEKDEAGAEPTPEPA